MTLSMQEAINRFDENEDRLNTFINKSGTYTPNSGLPDVETIPSFMARQATALAALSNIVDKGDWSTGISYSVSDVVKVSGTWYRCMIAHTSATFSTDYSNGKWVIYQGVTSNLLANEDGGTLVGYGDVESDATTTTVTKKLQELNMSESAKGFSRIPFNNNNGKNLSILGDSISHGFESLNTFRDGWVRVFQRCYNAEVLSNSYGFVNLLSMGSGGSTTTDIHSVNFNGTPCTGIDSSVYTEAREYPNGMAMRLGDNNSVISIVVPFFQNVVRVYFGLRSGSVNLNVYINGTLSTSTPTSGSGGYSYVDVLMRDNGYGECNIVIRSATTGVQPDVCGVAYLSGVSEPVLNNFSNSGRRLAYLGQTMIQQVMSESTTVILALGVNDQADADSNDTYYSQFQQAIGWLKQYCLQYKVKLFVADFVWSASPQSRTRVALKKLAYEVNGEYVNLPNELFKNKENIAYGTARSTYLTSTMQLFTDGTHPNALGHKWIAESIAKSMGLSVSSKKEALDFYDWWLPLKLELSVGVANVVNNDYNLISSYKKNGNSLIVKCYVNKTPASSFPTGSYTIQTAWNSKSNLFAKSGYESVPYHRSDTGAVVTHIACSSSGQIIMKVVDGTWTNAQQFSFVLPA